MRQNDSESLQDKRLHDRSVQAILKGGYGGKDARDYETRATDVQMAYERWVADDSSVRAYMTACCKLCLY